MRMRSHLLEEPMPSQADPVARAASEVIGGPLGRRAAIPMEQWDESPGAQEAAGASQTQLARAALRVMPWQPAAALASVFAGLFVAIGVLQKQYCLNHGWGVPEAFYRMCYQDMPYLFTSTDLVRGGWPYGGDTGPAHPVVTGFALWVTSLLVPGDVGSVREQQVYVGVWAVLTVLLVALMAMFVARSCRRTPYRAMHVALSPLIVTVALVSPDIVGVALATFGLYLWSRERPVEAGIVLGLAVAARTYPVLLLIAIGLLAWRTGRLRDWGMTALAAALTVGAALAAGAVASGGAVFAAYRTWYSSGAENGSIWFVFNLASQDVPPIIVTAGVVLGWILALTAGAVLALATIRRPTIAEVALVIVVIVLLTSKSLPVQSSLWLVPLVALAGLSWRTHLIWAATEVLHFGAIWLYLGGLSDANRGLPAPWYAVFLLLRLGGIAYLGYVVIHRARRRPALVDEEDDVTSGLYPDWPSSDPVAAVGADPDELAGPMAGRPDRMLVRLS